MKANAVGAVLVAATVACGMSACEATTEVQVQQEVAGVPGTVTDLKVVESNETSVILAFTQVDDGTGNPAKYAIRHGSPTMSWGPASPTEVSVDGTSIGAVLEYPHNSLQPGTDYEFQLVAYRGTLGSAEFGGLSNKVSASTEAVEAGDPASLTLSPSSATIRVGNSIELTAEVRDADGISVTDATVEWSTSNPGIATVSSEGVVSGTGIGTAVITATAMCGAVACSASTTDDAPVVVQEAPSGVHPNEPAGFTALADHPFDSEVPLGWTLFAGDSRYKVESDVTAPGSPPSIGSALFPKGFEGGSGPINLRSPELGVSEFYVEFWFKVSENWWGHAAGVKIFFINDDGRGTFFFHCAGSDDGPLQFEVRTQGTAGTPSAVNYGWARTATNGAQNRVTSATFRDAEIVRGEWRHIEVLIRVGTPGTADGEIHIWIDEKKIAEFTDQHVTVPGSDGKFDYLLWNPTFGGGNQESVPANQWQYIDHIYISGK